MMRFDVEQRFAVPPETLADTLHGREFLAHLGSSGSFGAPELLDHGDDGTVVVQRSRHRYDGPLPSAAGRFVDAARLSWVHESRFDRSTMRGEFTIRPDHYPDRLTAHGTESIARATDAIGSVRTVAGDLRVHVPFVAGKVERAIVDGIRDRLADEVGAFEAWWSRRPRPPA